MLLGIVLHAAIPFVPYYGAGDVGGEILFGMFEYIHLWRMPLFFVISGFFTAMLWRRRGLRALVRHRLRRVGLPLLIFYVPVIALILIGIIVGYSLAGDDLDDTFGQADAYEAPADETEREPTGEEDGEEDEFGFAHLWFLWHLLWLVAVFALIALGLERWQARGGRAPPAVLAWVLPPLSLVPFLSMQEDVLGPDTSDGIVPAPPVISFYAAFFFFGAVLYRDTPEPGPIDRLGRVWPMQLIASLGLFGLLYGGVVDEGSMALEVLAAWLVSFGMIGLFRTRLSEPSYRVRWLSDSSYWMYLMHLPLVFLFQGVAAGLGLPSIIAFVFIVVATVAILAPTYHGLVRYTAIGRLLNGRRTRDGDARLRAQLDVLSRS